MESMEGPRAERREPRWAREGIQACVHGRFRRRVLCAVCGCAVCGAAVCSVVCFTPSGSIC